MAIKISATSRYASANTWVGVTGLSPGTRYDIYRLYLNWDEDEDVYSRFYPDRRNRWSSVAHRIGWEATRSSHSFTDYEPPLRPFQYFVVKTTSVGPFEYDWRSGTYPTSRGTLGADIIHQRREIDALLYDDQIYDGNLRIRSTTDLGEFLDVCIYDMDDIKYAARGTEHAVMGRQYPVYVADTREARRGTVTLGTASIEEYEDLRDLVFPASGSISPLWLQTLKEDEYALLDDMLIIPLDVTIQQASRVNSDNRFIILDFVEIDPTGAQPIRTGDNDALVTAPNANFSISKRKLRRRQATYLYDTSTGQITSWTWRIYRAKKGRVNKKYGPGRKRASWSKAGRYNVRLTVRGPDGVDTRTRRVRVR